MIQKDIKTNKDNFISKEKNILNLLKSMHMSRIGCGLAGGLWDKIEPIINIVIYKKRINILIFYRTIKESPDLNNQGLSI